METKTKYAYELLMAEHKLTVAELPGDAQMLIKQIKAIDGAVALTERAGKKVAPATDAKVKAFDKYLVREILDYVEGKETNHGKAPDAAEIIAEIKDDKGTPPAEPKKDEPAVDPAGIKIDAEFAAMLKSGKSEATLDELKSLAPVAYDLIFKNHTNDLTNGITTSYYVLSETTANNFKLVKK